MCSCLPPHPIPQAGLLLAVSSAFIIDTRSKLQLGPSGQSLSSSISPQDRSVTTLFITSFILLIAFGSNSALTSSGAGMPSARRWDYVRKCIPRFHFRSTILPKTSVDESLAGRLDATWIGEARCLSFSDLSVRLLVCPPHSMWLQYYRLYTGPLRLRSHPGIFAVG